MTKIPTNVQATLTGLSARVSALVERVDQLESGSRANTLITASQEKIIRDMRRELSDARKVADNALQSTSELKYPVDPKWFVPASADVRRATAEALLGDTPPIQYIVAYGNAFDGMTLVGPFADKLDAEQYTDTDDDWRIIMLQAPAQE